MLVMLLNPAPQAQCPDLNITTTVYWTTSQQISSLVRIKYPGGLNISGNITISFMNSCAGILVEPGGYVSVANNAKLTGDGTGNMLWRGIEAQGAKYGVVGTSVTLNNCRIEYAQTGVKLGYIVDPIPLEATIEANNCAFFNNQTSVYKFGFNNPYGTEEIINCSFSINHNSPIVLTNQVRYIELVGPATLVISGTTFADGISSMDVQAINKQGGAQLTVSNCTFSGVDKGIYLQGSTTSDRILNNTFSGIPVIGISQFGGYQWGSNYGIFAVGSSKFRAEGNSFSGSSRLNADKIYGIVTDNSGANGALMFKNTFTNTTSGFQSQNSNPNYAVSCNTFTNYTYSGSWGPAWNTYNGSLRQQGNSSCSNSGDRAGNEWTTVCTGSNVVDIKVNPSSYFHYHGHFLDQSGTAKTRPECSTTAWEPTYVVANYCAVGTPGYQKTATACNAPFYTCSGCRLTTNNLGIDPHLVQAMEYYRGLVDDIDDQSELSGQNQHMEEQAAHYAGLEQLVSNEISSQLLQRNIDTAILYLESSDLLEDKKLLAELYFSTGRLSDCRGIVNNVRTSNGWRQARILDPVDVGNYSVENNEFTELFGLLLTVVESGRSLKQMKEWEVAVLERLSRSQTVTGPKACAFLKHVTGKECSYEIYNDDGNNDVKYKLDNTTASEITIAAYPNPANNLLIISVFLPEGEQSPELTVFDITGKEQERILLQQKLNVIELNTSAYAEGIYMLKVSTADGSRTLRFSVQK